MASLQTNILPNLITFGRLRSDHVSIYVQGPCEDQDMAEEGQWVSCRISASADCWSGEYEARIRLEDLEHFAEQLHSMDAGVGEKAIFETPENWLEITMFVDPRGLIEAAFICNSRSYPPAAISNSMTLDRSQLGPLISRMEETIRTFSGQ